MTGKDAGYRRAAVEAMVVLLGLAIIAAARGPVFWLVVGGATAAAVSAASTTIALWRRAPRGPPRVQVVVLSVCAVLAVAELGLPLIERGPTESQAKVPLLPEPVVARAHARHRLLTMPTAWRRREVEVAGATRAYVWHDALHVVDARGHRRTSQIPPRDPNRVRVAVFGDSFTFGQGVDERWTFPRLLDAELRKQSPVEVLNLGVSNLQSADVLAHARKMLPELKPDVVIYVVCLNDFLPSGTGTWTRYRLPKRARRFVERRSRVAQVAFDGFEGALLELNLRHDFVDVIVAGGRGYRERFARDVAAINQLVLDAGLPPAIGLVFQHMPGGDPRGWEVTYAAEDALTAGGFDVVSVRDWRERYAGESFPVSRWELHPNEIGHALVAERLARHLVARQLWGARQLGDED